MLYLFIYIYCTDKANMVELNEFLMFIIFSTHPLKQQQNISLINFDQKVCCTLYVFL